MAEPAGRKVWVGRGIYLGLAFLIIFIQLLPLDQRPTLFSPPDMLLVLTFVWVARRPEFVPFLMVGCVFFLADLLFQRPPGLFAALVLIGTEVVRSRFSTARDTTVLGEWGLIAMVIVVIAIINRATLAMTLTPQPSQAQTILHILATLVAIPFVMAAAQFIFGVRHLTPGQYETTGSRS